MKLTAHLLANGRAPTEYIELALCREFHCLPSQLRRERATDMLNTLTMLRAESKARKALERLNRGKRR